MTRIFTSLSKLCKLIEALNLGSQVQIMQKSIFFVPNVYESSIESLDYFFDRAKVNISDIELVVFFFLMEFNQSFVFKKSYPTSAVS